MARRKRNLYPDKYNDSTILISWTRLPHLEYQLKQAGLTGSWLQRHLFRPDEIAHKEIEEVIIRNSFDIEV